jgi:hypothetical protein
MPVHPDKPRGGTEKEDVPVTEKSKQDGKSKKDKKV